MVWSVFTLLCYVMVRIHNNENMKVAPLHMQIDAFALIGQLLIPVHDSSRLSLN